ncbi:molybdate ABC transporter substrate-binding protein [Corynebacterium accolens]|uniref:molybdate ABC transporter substrate-binding protein n=1 Tax=Corynebacterium accolens TaxID=38284 RepID=UPI00254F9105|nr:molybdate ABC transporter substrate-binding protein [Corynebacterium accolens]MDK8504808.1 molybdate ABC transporter substrate-binding protein [Corynebacterium accolens]MDK8661739.1 molybdate ABC transporter substrate-binding protein [Corynebacterium accolens]
MNKKFAAAAVAATGLALSACSPDTSSNSDSEETSLNLLAASSTRVINDELEKRASELDTPVDLEFQNGGSSDLVNKLSEGAPADLLLTASKKTMDKAISDGTVKDPKVLATNVMVMVVPKGNPGNIHSIEDLQNEDRFVICDPQVPCGDISSQIIEENNLDVKPASQEQQVADVLGKVVSGEANAGWVYSTDAAAAGDDVEVIEIPDADKFANQILGAVSAEAEHPEEAQKVLDLLADDFDKTWEEYGFNPAD